MTSTRRALITGVTGQDGWYLSELLIADGYQVYGLVHDTDTAPVPDDVIAITGDLSDEVDVQDAVNCALPNEVYNLGGISSVALSWEQPLHTAEVTGLGFLRVITGVQALAAARDMQVRIVQ
ncbi:MAG: GDP-mannose 4,6-dehydratase, partial [Actinobacteria bacterium]|nr:GDP-mannose 4,6-dehydratase [Actinomycetota bacterium]